MSLTDTAEYWWDIKNKPAYNGPSFYHHPTYQCSHINTLTGSTARTPYIEDINCYECKKYIQENGTGGLKEGKGSPDFYMTKTAAKKWRKYQRKLQEQESKYGKCSCGSHWQIRKNKSTGQKFLGCLQYPVCKNTKSL